VSQDQQPSGAPCGVVVALCAGHRCAALTARRGDGGLTSAIARSSGGILISATCVQRCTQGAVAAVAFRSDGAEATGPSVWLGGIDAEGRLASLGRWVEQWRWDDPDHHELPADLTDTVLGVGRPIRLAHHRQGSPVRTDAG
jgi:hypothetical protein